MDPTIPSNAWDREGKEETQNNPKNTNEQQLSLETKNGKIGVMGNRVLLGMWKVTATKQLKADHPLTAKATKPKIYPNYRGKTKNGFNKGRNKRSYMVLYALQKVLYRKH